MFLIFEKQTIRHLIDFWGLAEKVPHGFDTLIGMRQFKTINRIDIGPDGC